MGKKGIFFLIGFSGVNYHLGCPPLPRMPVTTRIIMVLVGDSKLTKPAFATGIVRGGTTQTIIA